MNALRAEVRDLYDDYASCLDEMDLRAWSGFFTDDCTYKVISFENYSQDLPLALIECRGIGMVRDRVAVPALAMAMRGSGPAVVDVVVDPAPYNEQLRALRG